MMTANLTLLMMISCMIIWISNPVMMSMVLIFVSTLSLMEMNAKMGMSWFPLMFYLLFMGGIIVMFLILSSLVPNQPMSKKIPYKVMTLMLLSSTLLIQPFNESNQVPTQTVLGVKISLADSLNLIMLTLLIMLYFMILSTFILEVETPLRSENCYKKKKFCKFFDKK